MAEAFLLVPCELPDGGRRTEGIDMQDGTEGRRLPPVVAKTLRIGVFLLGIPAGNAIFGLLHLDVRIEAVLVVVAVITLGVLAISEVGYTTWGDAVTRVGFGLIYIIGVLMTLSAATSIFLDPERRSLFILAFTGGVVLIVIPIVRVALKYKQQSGSGL